MNLIPHESLPSKRLIYASVGSVTKDFDDVRRYLAAGKNAARRHVHHMSRSKDASVSLVLSRTE